MAGLSLIGTYSSDSENDDENSCDNRDVPEKIDKHPQCNLPLPQSILTWKGVEHHEEVNDDPNEHEGRTRTFKHERGNWATLIFAEYEPDENVKNWMKSVSEELPVEGKYPIQRLHLSLSRTLILKFHWIESFVDSVKKLCAELNRFTIELCDVEVYCNDERTRTFLAIRCETIDDTLRNLTDSFNKLLTEYQLPPFYEDASYHISFMSNNGDIEELLKPFVPSLTTSLGNVLTENSGCRVTIDRLYCKIGCRLYSFQLK